MAVGIFYIFLARLGAIWPERPGCLRKNGETGFEVEYDTRSGEETEGIGWLRWEDWIGLMGWVKKGQRDKGGKGLRH
jgi:hypothetical protein